jgi:hypothetical protein
MNFNRRIFMSLLLAAPKQATVATRQQGAIDVEVMEVFSSRGPSALLVHHADEPTREAFANWLRRNSGAEILLQSRDRTPIEARIFRVSLCFGRGLILLRTPLAGIQAKDVLSVRLR